MNTEIDVKKRLLEFGIKPSLHRMAIMEYLMTYLIHPTADTIFNNLYPLIPTLSKTTVYNTLKLLEEQGAVLALNIDEKYVRYDSDISRHAHFKCKRCAEVRDFRIKGIKALEIKNADGDRITECQIYYKGYCKKCRNEIRNEILKNSN
jgi:Fur family ferric uptake transcriptional regulator/Fur family peroxide stress response transcriptional regulator